MTPKPVIRGIEEPFVWLARMLPEPPIDRTNAEAGSGVHG